MHEDDFFIIHNSLVLIAANEAKKWIIQNRYLHIWLLHLNRLQYGTPHASRSVGNIPEFMPLDNLLNYDILQSLLIFSVLICYILDGEETNEDESTI